jgi:hypothetical protein
LRAAFSWSLLVKVHEPFKGDENYDGSKRSLYFNFQFLLVL